MSNTNTMQLSHDSGFNVEIHKITVKEAASLASVDLLIDANIHSTQWKNQKDVLQTTLDPPCIVSYVSALTLRLHYCFQVGRIRIPKKHKDIIVDVNALLLTLQGDGGTMKEWRGEYDRTVVTIAGQLKGAVNDASQLSSTTGNITALCPQFRILVIGKSGSGKSSLINTVFGVEKAKESRWTSGKANIEEAITSDQNKRLVLHDSLGFEPGEVDTVEMVNTFIDKKRKEPDIKDRLHAVWLCLEIPIAGGRLMEEGVEDFLKRKTCGELGTLPVIVVYTKYDLLIRKAKRDADPARINGLSAEDIIAAAKEDAQERLDEILSANPLDVAIPRIVVSTKKTYEETIDQLVAFTFFNVEKYVAPEASVVVAIAQQASARVKIDGCITVGKTKYWNGLASGTNFLGKSLKACLEVLHIDIVEVWNFKDPHKYLRGTQFQTLMYNLVNDLADQAPRNPTGTLTVGFSVVGTIAAIVSAVSGPAAPIVVPIVASTAIAVWLYEVYQQSSGTLRRLMAYIVDLTIIMQTLYWVTITDSRPMTIRHIKFVVKAYMESQEKVQVHCDITNYVKQAGIFERAGRDSVLEKVEELINCNRFESAEMHRLKDEMGNVNLSVDDEQW